MEAIWFVGDNFFRDVFPALTSLRNQATFNRNRPPYIYEFYNIFGYCQSSASQVRGLPRFFNPMIEALNARVRLPRYIIFILDLNFIEHVDDSIEGDPAMYPKLISWLVNQVETTVRR